MPQGFFSSTIKINFPPRIRTQAPQTTFYIKVLMEQRIHSNDIKINVQAIKSLDAKVG